MKRLLVVSLLLLGAGPADQLPDPQPERCEPFLAEIGEGESATPEGLSYPEVAGALNAVIQTALQCGRPPGMSEAHLTFELWVGCDGLVSKLDTVDDGGAPADWVTCVADVIRKADFPAHDNQDGVMVTYPVDVRW